MRATTQEETDVKPEPFDSANEPAAEREFSVRDALRTSLSDNTRSAYRTGWRRFTAWCDAAGTNPMAATPDDLASFVVQLASRPPSPAATTAERAPLSVATIRVYLAAIGREYRERNRPSPVDDSRVAAVLRGLGRRRERRERRVKALREEELARILACCDEQATSGSRGLITVRDAALLAAGFAGALRRSELCALLVEDVEFLDDPLSLQACGPGGQGPAPHGRAATAADGASGGAAGMFLHIRRSKTDQFGRGQRVAVPEGRLLRPVSRLRRWLALSGIDRGPLFQTMRRGGHVQGRPLHPTDVARLVKRYAAATGLDPAHYAGHSLRAGFVTSAAAHGARLDKIMEVTRHASPATVMRYIRHADAFEDHAGAAFL